MKMLPCARFKNKLITLKTKVLSSFLYLTTALLLVSFSDPYSIKRISDADFRYEFYTTDKKISPKDHKTYYWFKGGLIHNAQGGLAGELLDGKFIKMFHSNQLAEQGVFKKGLKVALWKTWYANGIIETMQKWSNGLKNGVFYRYSESGTMVEKGNFKNGQKHGTWIDYIKKDTVLFKRGIVVVQKQKLSKEEIEESKIEAKKLKEEKKKIAAAKKAANEEAKAQKSKGKDFNKTPENKPGKDGFFKRLFSKKQPKKNVNGQGA